MDPQDQITIAAVLTTLADVGGSPESILYMGTGCDLEKWNQIRYALTGAGLIDISNYWVKLTDAGRALAAQLDAAMKGAA